jgi:hypothetical protein
MPLSLKRKLRRTRGFSCLSPNHGFMRRTLCTSILHCRNTSKESFYISASVHPTRSSPYGQYRVQTKRRGSRTWETVQEYAEDPFPEAHPKPLSPEEWQVRNNLFLLEPDHSIGLRQTGTWKGLTTKGTGIYELRLIYSALDLPIKLDKAFLTGTVISNVVQVEVMP